MWRTKNLVNPTGSYAIGAFHLGGDIDLVCMSSESREEFFERLGVQLIKLHCSCSVAVGAVVPILRTTIKGIPIEIQHCRVPESLIKSQPLPIRTSDLFLALRKLHQQPTQQLRDDAAIWDDADERAVSAWADMQAISSAVPESVCDVFVKMLAIVKQWSSSRGVYSAKMGYPGGIGWTVLCVRIIQKELAKSPAAITVDHLVEQFFATYSALEFKNCSLSIIGQQPGSVARGSNANGNLDHFKAIFQHHTQFHKLKRMVSENPACF